MPIRMEISLSGDKELRGILQGLLDVNARLEPILRRCVTVIRRSTNKTFSEGGRPQKWPARWDAMEYLFPNLKGKNVLKVSGRLRQSVVQNPTVVITKDSLTYGTNLEYAKTQQMGGPSKVKVPEERIRYRKKDGMPYVVLHGKGGYFAKHLASDGTFTINVRPRPFLQFLPEDVAAITEVFRSSLEKILQRRR